MELTLTQEQDIALAALFDYVNYSSKPYITLAGYAGTGKTTVLGEFAKQYSDNHKSVAFATYTGKASTVLRSKLPQGFIPSYCGTIHSMIYDAKWDEKDLRWKYFLKPSLPFDLIVIDESSMVSKKILDDILIYEIPTIIVGDHGQLPPIKSDFNPMGAPDIKLETIVRQAEGNPIIRLSKIIRDTGKIPLTIKGASNIIKTSQRNLIDVLNRINYSPDNTKIICATNKTRCGLNSKIRSYLNIQYNTPVAGERLICLRNNKEYDIYNGLEGVLSEDLRSVRQYPGVPEWLQAFAKIDLINGSSFSGNILMNQFGHEKTIVPQEKDCMVDFFDWAYAITCHKSQGSEYDRVILYQESIRWYDFDMRKRWLYTAVTRAKNDLIILT